MGVSQTGLTPSESVGNYTELREAANSLSRYVSFATKDKLTAVSSIVTSNLQSRETGAGGSVKSLISTEFAQKLELVVGSSEGAPLFDAAAALLGETDAIQSLFAALFKGYLGLNKRILNISDSLVTMSADTHG
jgi:molybdopterin-binding protein